MRVLLDGVLTPDALARIRTLLAGEAFVDGRETSTLVGKHNLQLSAPSSAYDEASALVLQRLRAHEAFELGVWPKLVLPPLFSRYDVGMEYPEHVDNGVMGGLRADVAVTVFLSDKDAYEGGELVVDSGNGERLYRLDAGDAIAYPASTLHRVAPVTRGTRLAAVLWVQSLLPDPAQRQLVHELGAAVRGLEQGPYGARLRRSYWNLVRMWAEA